MNLKLNDILQRNLALPSTAIDNDIVVMNVENNEYYAMDTAAAQIWAWLEQPTAFSTILNRVENEYQIYNSNYQHQTQAFLTNALNKNLLHIVNANTTQTLTQNDSTLDTLIEKSTWQSAPTLRIFAIDSFTQLSGGAAGDGGFGGS